MTTDLVPVSPTAQALALIEPAADLAQRMASTTFVPKEYRGKPNELLAAILTGDELGVGPMAAMAKIHNIQGRAGVSSELMRAVVLSKGHQIWVEHSSSTKVTVAGHRKGNPDQVSRFTWTIDMAKTAGLAGKQVWRQFPQAMLLARCTGELCRAIFADCLSGISYTTEELEDGFIDVASGTVEAGDAPEGAAPAPPAGNRRSRPAAKKAATRPPAPAPAEPEKVDPVRELDELDAVAGGQAPAEPEGKSTEQKRTELVIIRTKEVLGNLDRAGRLAFLTASTGREVASTKDLTAEEVDLVLVDLDQIKAGQAEWTEGELVHTPDGETPAEDAGAAPAAASGSSEWEDLDADDWAATIEQAGLGKVATLRQAAAIAGQLEVEAPASIAGIAEADPRLRSALGVWVTAEAS